MLNRTNPISVEQSLMGFLRTLGVSIEKLYNEEIINLITRGKIRYTDFNLIESVFQSIDGQYQIVIINKPDKAEGGVPLQAEFLAFFIKLYPKPTVLNQKYYRSWRRITKDLKEEKLERLNLRQHKTTLNLYANEIPSKIKENLGCTNNYEAFI